MGSPFKELFNDRKFHIILSIILLLWIILLSISFINSDTGFNISGSDGYITLMQAKAWFEGHPLKLNASDEGFAGTSDYLYPLILSTGYWLGFRGQDSFILWTYIMNLLLLIGTSLFLYRFFKKFFPDVAFFASLISILFAPFFANFFMCTNFSVFLFFLTGALAFLDSLPFFIAFAILTSLSRPEGIIPYLFLSSVYLSKNGLKNTWKLAAGFVLTFIPMFLNIIITGQLSHQGALSQSLLNYDSFTNVIKYASFQFMDHIKGTLLGFYHTVESFGMMEKGDSTLSFPPLLFIFFLIGIASKSRKWIAIPSAVYLFILISIDSLSLLSGLQFNRHILPVFPFLFVFSLLGIKKVNVRLKGFYNISIIVILVFISIQNIVLFTRMKDNISHASRNREVSGWLNMNLPEGEAIIDGTRGNKSIAYGIKDRKIVYLTPNLNPSLGRYINAFWRATETTELIQRYYSHVDYILVDGNDLEITNWLVEFSKNKPQVFSWIGEQQKYYLYKLDLSPLDSKRFSKGIADEVDIGDPVSEKEHLYRRTDISGFELRELPRQIDGIYDGGRVTEGSENFYINYPENGGNLICLFGKKFNGTMINLKRTVTSFEIPAPEVRIYINGIITTEVDITKDFELINIFLKPYRHKEPVKIEVYGRFISYHYWVIR